MRGSGGRSRRRPAGADAGRRAQHPRDASRAATYRAPSLLGPWRIEYAEPAPALSLRAGGEVRRSAENPTPITTSADPAC